MYVGIAYGWLSEWKHSHLMAWIDKASGNLFIAAIIEFAVLLLRKLLLSTKSRLMERRSELS